ncbi:MAG: hypothetical protein A2Y10_07520 [Planctomycetes bacterium GWF2_41_51]|nr:MAG: hypothetical protein A2Y10_07520 [Planctomycetes bacterium GWF2_41_51]HBG27204.1 hypothetical protein [Phycisphaerales bacterium]
MRRSLSLLLVLVVAALSQAEIIQIDNFESYTNTIALKTEWANTANVTLTLDTAEVHGGAKSMKYAYNNGANPWYAKAEYNLNEVEDWTGTTSVNFWYKVTAKKEPMWIKLVVDGGNAYQKNFGSVSVGDWTEGVLDLTQPDSYGNTLTAYQISHIGRIDIVFSAVNYGAGTVYFDDFTRTVPEPATVALLSLGGLLLRRRK